MTAVKMYIGKFKKVVLIDDQHPLALAEIANPSKRPKKEDDAPTISGKTAEEVAKLSKKDVLALVEQVKEKYPDFIVSREDGGEGEPEKTDYIAALSRAVPA